MDKQPYVFIYLQALNNKMKLINIPVIFKIQSNILMIVTVLLLICVPVALIYGEPLLPFLLSAFITVVLSSLLPGISLNADMKSITLKDGYLSVALSWFVFSAFGALPFLISGVTKNFTDAFFETVSGVTTTGASIFTDVEVLPKSILFWRSLTHWIGGLGIIVLVIIILPSFSITNYSIFSMESSLKEKFHPKTRAIGFRLLYIYLGLTAAETILLYLGEMDLFESICHTFGTVATGGFSTRNASIAAFSEYSQYVVMIFMFLSGISFVVYYYLIKFNFRKIKNNEELWFYIGVCIIAGALAVSILNSGEGLPFKTAFREGFFQTISIITTTGYATADYLKWPVAGTVLIFLLFFTGASTGSTTGNIKMARHLLVLKNVREIFKKLLHPNAVIRIRFNDKVLDRDLNISILSYVVIYLFVFLVSSFMVSLFGLDLLTSVSAVATSLGSIGAGFGSVGPASNYAHISQPVKIILSLLMIFGRLELMTVIVLFTPGFWKK